MPSSAAAGVPRFVGRADELRSVTDALGRSPAVVLVEGEAGIGKSRLVREALAAGAGGGRWLIAVCPPFREGLTLGPIVDAARQAVPDDADAVLAGLGLSALAGALRPLFPEWADSLPPAPEPLDDAGAARHRLMRAFAELLDRLRIAVLVVEDIHWADDATLEFLLFLASLQPLPFSLVLTYRPEEVAAGSLLRRLSSRPPTGTGVSHARVGLGALAGPDATELVVSMLGGSVSAAFTAFLHESTGGVPLVLEECVRLLLDRADLVRRDGEWVQRTLAEIVVPPTIRDAITERVARLGADAQRVLLAAAVLAEPADERTLRLVSGLPGVARTESAVAQATVSGLLVEERSRPGRLAFRHSLAARAVYDQAPVPERRAAHRRAAELLETVRPRPVGRLAHHFRQAEEIPRWRRYAEQATDVALASGDHRRALTLLHELITEPGLPAEAVAPLVQKMPFHAFIDDARRTDIVAALRAVLETDRLSPHDRAQVRGQLGRVFFSLGDYTAAAVEWELAIPDLGAGTFADAWAMIMLGWPWAGPWPVATHLRWLERGWRLAQASALAPHQRMILLVNRVSVLLGLGQESGWTIARELADDESTPQLAHERARGELNLGDAALRWGRYDEARRRLASAADIAGRHGYQVVRVAALVTRLRLDYLAGAWPGLAERAREWAAKAEEPVCRLEAQLVAAQLTLADGDPGEVEDTLAAVQEECVRRGIIAQWLESAAARGQLRLGAGDAEGALAVTEDGIRLVLDKGIWLWATQIAPVRVAALTAAGQIPAAEALVEAFAGALPPGLPMPAPQAALAECRAALTEGRGQFEAAAAAWRVAEQAWSEVSRPHDAARARAAVERCSRASRGTRGAPGTRGTRPSGRPGYGARLSPRELEVVRLMLDGRTNRQIARELSKSPDTVAAQLKSAMRKYGVTSRTALAVSVTQAESGIF